MIKGINSSTRYISVSGGTSSTYISKSYVASQTGFLGDVMYDLDNQCFKIYDGQQWQQYHGQYATIELTSDTCTLLEWVREKRNHELELERKAEENVTLRALLQERDELDRQILMTEQLVK